MMASDIEVFIRDRSVDEIRDWLATTCGPMSDFEEAGAALICRSGNLGFVITPRIEDGPFTSIWFSAKGTPWQTQVECARQAAQQMGVPVRCTPGPTFAKVQPCSDVVLEISEGQERLIAWE